MDKLPDVRNEVRGHFEFLKSLVVKSVAHGETFAPLYIFVTLTPDAQAELGFSDTIGFEPRWKQGSNDEKARVLGKIVAFCNRYSDCVIMCGSGMGIYAGFEHGSGETPFIFVSMFMPGFEPWTLAQIYTVVDHEVIFDVERCTSDGNVSVGFGLPGLWEDR